MSDRTFSVILLPTAECNVACEYCFEHKEAHRLSLLMVPLLTQRLLEHMEREGIEECEIYWQGGEAMIMGPDWFREAGEIMQRAAGKVSVAGVFLAICSWSWPAATRIGRQVFSCDRL